MKEMIRVSLMAMLIAYWITWFVGSISHIMLQPICHSAVQRDTMIDCIRAMPWWLEWFWQAGYGWFG